MKFIIILIVVAIGITIWQYFRDDDKKEKGSRQTSSRQKEKLSAEEKGEIGEKTIREKILRELNPNERMLNNYITRGTSSITSQIDHIVIKPAGVFVIETKNYDGKIYGKRTDMKWTQVLAGGRVKNQFYNPIKQNETHIRNIRKIIGENVPVYSMIVFPKGDINAIALIDEVYTPHRMMLKFQYTANEKRISDEEILNIYNNLKDHKQYISDGEHVANVNSYLRGK